jgi:DNA-binding IclR family transcriptional regulator
MPTITQSSGVGVLDKSMAVLSAVERGARTLNDIVSATALSRATAHRLASALDAQGLLSRDASGGDWRLGLRLFSLGTAALRSMPIAEAARPALTTLRTATGESAQLYIRDHDERVCISAVESRNGLRTIVREGAAFPLTAGSAGKVFMAWASDEDRTRLVASAEKLTPETPVDPAKLEMDLEAIRGRGWAESVGEREPGVASVSVPVRDARGNVLAAVSVSGPIERTGRDPGSRYASEVTAAAQAIERAIGVDSRPVAG